MGIAAKASQRDEVERLARYVSRPAVATQSPVGSAQAAILRGVWISGTDVWVGATQPERAPPEFAVGNGWLRSAMFPDSNLRAHAQYMEVADVEAWSLKRESVVSALATVVRFHRWTRRRQEIIAERLSTGPWQGDAYDDNN